MQKNVSIGDTTYAVTALESEGRWIAEARRVPSGMRIGPSGMAATADEAIGRLEHWLEWQREHEDALTTLQGVEQAYHRAVAGSAFASGLAEATEVQQEALKRVEEARVRLEEIRQEQPEI